jgi:similar to stage IV sporulation protein
MGKNMPFFSIVSYLMGYVVILVKGKSPEKFINLAFNEGIVLWDITSISKDKLLLKVRLSAVRTLRQVARKTNCRFWIQKRTGAPFLYSRIKRRKSMALGIVIFVLGLYFLSSFIWLIEITGNHYYSSSEVLGVAAEAGLKRGILKNQLKPRKIERVIQNRLPEVAWVGISVKGTKVSVEIVEKDRVKKEKNNIHAHVIAKKTGIIKEILVINGQVNVQEEDTVVPGQILISVIVLPVKKPEEILEKEQTAEEAEKPLYVHAKGVVRARVWYNGYGEAYLKEKGQRYTGRTATRISLVIGFKELKIFNPSSIPFAEYKKEVTKKKLPSWRSFKPPVELIKQKYYELENYECILSREEARQKARQKAWAKAKKQVPEQAVIIRQETKEIAGNKEELVRIRMLVETKEDIGTEKTF